jgi:hypothetical protein
MIQGAAFRVLACFYDQDRASFTTLCENAGYPTDLGGYYLRQLVSGGYVEKIDRGTYGVTAKGKQQLAFHYGKEFFAPRPRMMVLFVPRVGDAYIALKRKVQPFMNTHEWPAGAVNMGEPLEDALVRLETKRLGQSGEHTFHGFFRRTDFYEDTVFDDKLFAVYTCSFPKETILAPSSNIGENIRCSREELFGLKKYGKAFTDVLSFTEKTDPVLEEHTYVITIDDL